MFPPLHKQYTFTHPSGHGVLSVMFPTDAWCFKAGGGYACVCACWLQLCYIISPPEDSVNFLYQLFQTGALLLICGIAAVCSYFNDCHPCSYTTQQLDLPPVLLLTTHSALLWLTPPSLPHFSPYQVSCSLLLRCAVPSVNHPSGKDMRAQRCWEAPLPGGFSDCRGVLWWWKASRPGLTWIPCRQAGTQTGSR